MSLKRASIEKKILSCDIFKFKAIKVIVLLS